MVKIKMYADIPKTNICLEAKFMQNIFLNVNLKEFILFKW